MLSNRRSGGGGGGGDDDDEDTNDSSIESNKMNNNNNSNKHNGRARISLASVSSSGSSAALASPSETLVVGGGSVGGGGVVGTGGSNSSNNSGGTSSHHYSQHHHLTSSSSSAAPSSIMPNWANNGNMGPVMYVPFVPLNSPYFQQQHQPSHPGSVNGSINMASGPAGSNYTSFTSTYSMPPAPVQPPPTFHPNLPTHSHQMYSSLMGPANGGSAAAVGAYASLPLANSMSHNTLSASSSLSNLSSSTGAAFFPHPHHHHHQHGNSSTQSISPLLSTLPTLPHIEFKPVDFGAIAEGCLSELLVRMHVTNADAILGSLDSMSGATFSLDVELPAFNHWNIEPVDWVDSSLGGGSGWNTKAPKSSLLLKKINKVFSISNFYTE